MSGQQIGCPHCHSAVLLPDLGAALYAPPAPTWEEFASLAPPAADFRPPESFPQPAASYIDSSAPPQPSAPPQSASVDELLPPSADKRRPARPVPVAKEERAAAPEHELPPTAKKKKSRSHRRPAAKDSSPQDDLLPPAARPAVADAKKDEISHDELLPPNAGTKDVQDASATKQIPAEAPVQRHRRPGEAADGSVLIPTEEGGYIALREPIKTVSAGGREVELRRLTPEEKASRRFKRNVFVAVFGLLFLIVFLLVAGYLSR
jgi:hypothetical protein